MMKSTGIRLAIAAWALASAGTAQDQAITPEQRLSEGKHVLAPFASPPHVGSDRDSKIRGQLTLLDSARITEHRFVDRDELYERRLAMYEGARFETPLARTNEDGEAAPTGRRRTARAAVKTPAQDHTFGIFLSIALVSFCGLAYFIARMNDQRRS